MADSLVNGLSLFNMERIKIMQFNSTRNNKIKVDASHAISKGLSDDGGLFVPENFPQLADSYVDELSLLTYPERAAKIIGMYLTDYSEAELLDMCVKAYSTFDGEPAPVVKLRESTFVLELWHGKTCAFKDMALALLPYLMTAAKEKQHIDQEIKILVATSGDTGKAALEGFKDVEKTSIIVFYPSDGVSDVQKLQMTTQEGSNVGVAGVIGNFDDCQSAVKRVFADREVNETLKENGFVLSSANSINFGRLVPQIVYYVSAYVDLVSSGEIEADSYVNFVVPTGNFGNILAAYYAKCMGVKINKLICASNANRILTDFFKTGVYDVNREFFKTMSPSMDILISSNLERLLYEMSGKNDNLTKQRMENMKSTGKYEISAAELERILKTFVAGSLTEEETVEAIEYFFDECDYVFDPHTAVAAGVYRNYVNKNQSATPVPTVIVSTASPYKFASDVYESLMGEHESDAFKAIKKLYDETAVEIPSGISELNTKKVRFHEVVDRNTIKDYVIGLLKK